MSIINRLLKELFPEKKAGKKSDKKELLRRESIQRNQIFLADYQSWLQADMHKGLLKHLHDLRKEVKSGASENEMRFFLHSEPASKGFYFNGETPWTSRDYDFFIHYLLEIIKDLGYALKNTKREVVEENGRLKTFERFYLKPSLKFRKEAPYQQLYGNVLVEHLQEENQTVLVKLMTYTYDDRNFQAPFDFEIFMDQLLTCN